MGRRKLILLVTVLVTHCLGFTGIAEAARNLNGITISQPVSEQEGLQQARALVVMLEANSQPIGAATIVGMNEECLYLATAAHVLQASNEIYGRFWFEQSTTRKLNTTQFVDQSIDLAILCLPDPETTLIPLPPMTGVRLGAPQHLEGNDPFLVIGHSEKMWHVRHGLVIDHIDQNNLLVDGNIHGNDSGGGVFSPEVTLLEVVGIVVRTKTVLKISEIAKRMNRWSLPFGLTEWDFRLASELDKQARMIDWSNVAWPGFIEKRDKILRNLFVTIDSGKLRKGSGLVIGHDDQYLYLSLPQYLVNINTLIKAVFSDSSERVVEVIGESDSRLEIAIGRVKSKQSTLTALDLQHAPALPGSEYVFPRPLDSPYADRAARVQDLQVGIEAFHYGFSPVGEVIGVLSPKSVILETKLIDSFTVRSNAIPANKRGGFILNDRYEILGIVTGRIPGGRNSYKVARIDQVLKFAKEKGGKVKLETPAPQWRSIATQVNGFEAPQSDTCWSRSVLTGGQDRALDITVQDNDRILIAGKTDSFGADGNDGVLMRVDPTGELVEFRTSGVVFDDEYLSVASLNGSTTVTGSSLQERSDYVSLADRHFRLGTINLQGAPTLLLGSEQSHWQLNKVKIDGDHIYAAGLMASDNVVQGGAFQKYSITTGKLAWQTFIENTNPFNGLAVTKGVVVGGGPYISPGPNRSQDIFIAAVDADNGAELWRYHPHFDNSSEEINALASLADGSIVAVGDARPDDGRWYGFAIKLSAHGKLLWQKEFKSTLYETSLQSVAALPNSGFVVAGELYWDHEQERGRRHSHGWLLGSDSNGNIQWQKHYAPKYQFGTRSGTFFSVDADDAGNVVAAGYTSVLSMPQNLWIVKTSPTGAIDCDN